MSLDSALPIYDRAERHHRVFGAARPILASVARRIARYRMLIRTGSGPIGCRRLRAPDRWAS